MVVQGTTFPILHQGSFIFYESKGDLGTAQSKDVIEDFKKPSAA